MTIQQLEYILAVDKYRHFVKASKECGVRQPTLSHMIKKLEEELGVVIFDRSKHPIEPTAMGKKLIEQARIGLREFRKLNDIVLAETENISGPLKVGVIPTLAPYVVPEFIKVFNSNYADAILTMAEMTTAQCIYALKHETIDLFIAATPLEEEEFYEIPLYYEKFIAYFSKGCIVDNKTLSASDMPKENLWVLEEGHCLRDQVFNFCQREMAYNESFQAGSVATLIRTVDSNGGYTVIPEMHISSLSESQKRGLKEIADPPAVREVSIVIRKDFIKERMINAVANTIKEIIPESMLDKRLKQFSIKL